MNDSALVTDLYELTMLQAYFDEGMGARAVFELFVRALPPQRNFLVAAGLEQALDYLEQLHFTADELAWLSASGRFKPAFLDWLRGFRFSGDVDAMGEGTVFFADEPILRVEAPIGEAQFVESRLLNLLNFSTLIATKAARCVLAAPGKLLVDFGLRRAHGAEAGVLAARASYLAGFAGSATVLAGQRFGVPVFGTMAHAYIEAHQFETEAFTRFSASQPSRVTLLIDTYDTEAAAAKVVALAPTLKARGAQLVAVRIDSGDLAAHAHRVRAIFDGGGLAEVGIFASGNLDEHRIAARRGGADRRFRHRHPAHHLGRRPRARLGLQAPKLCRRAAAQALRRQGHLARREAGVSPLRGRRFAPVRPCHPPRGAAARRGRRAAPAGAARRRAPGPVPGTRRPARACRRQPRPPAGCLAPAGIGRGGRVLSGAYLAGAAGIGRRSRPPATLSGRALKGAYFDRSPPFRTPSATCGGGDAQNAIATPKCNRSLRSRCPHARSIASGPAGLRQRAPMP